MGEGDGATSGKVALRPHRRTGAQGRVGRGIPGSSPWVNTDWKLALPLHPLASCGSRRCSTGSALAARRFTAGCPKTPSPSPCILAVMPWPGPKGRSKTGSRRASKVIEAKVRLSGQSASLLELVQRLQEFGSTLFEGRGNAVVYGLREVVRHLFQGISSRLRCALDQRGDGVAYQV